MFVSTQRSNAIVEDVTGSNFFLSDTHKLKSFRKNLEPLKENLKKLLEAAKKNRHYLERLEVSYKSFLISRSSGNDSTLDLCINRDLPMAPFDTRFKNIFFKIQFLSWIKPPFGCQTFVSNVLNKLLKLNVWLRAFILKILLLFKDKINKRK